MAIRSLADEETETLFKTGRSRRWNDIARTALRKLDMFHAAVVLSDLRAPPGNRLEALTRGRTGEHSNRINDQFRICFRWTLEGPDLVHIVGCH